MWKTTSFSRGIVWSTWEWSIQKGGSSYCLNQILGPWSWDTRGSSGYCHGETHNLQLLNWFVYSYGLSSTPHQKEEGVGTNILFIQNLYWQVDPRSSSLWILSYIQHKNECYWSGWEISRETGWKHVSVQVRSLPVLCRTEGATLHSCLQGSFGHVYSVPPLCLPYISWRQYEKPTCQRPTLLRRMSGLSPCQVWKGSLLLNQKMSPLPPVLPWRTNQPVWINVSLNSQWDYEHHPLWTFWLDLISVLFYGQLFIIFNLYFKTDIYQDCDCGTMGAVISLYTTPM